MRTKYEMQGQNLKNKGNDAPGKGIIVSVRTKWSRLGDNLLFKDVNAIVEDKNSNGKDKNCALRR
jgi:hypothetical protein